MTHLLHINGEQQSAAHAGRVSVQARSDLLLAGLDVLTAERAPL
jgi:hypothetical protein